jgi:hypothetical protein
VQFSDPAYSQSRIGNLCADVASVAPAFRRWSEITMVERAETVLTQGTKNLARGALLF